VNSALALMLASLALFGLGAFWSEHCDWLGFRRSTLGAGAVAGTALATAGLAVAAGAVRERGAPRPHRWSNAKTRHPRRPAPPVRCNSFCEPASPATPPTGGAGGASVALARPRKLNRNGRVI